MDDEYRACKPRDSDIEVGIRAAVTLNFSWSANDPQNCGDTSYLVEVAVCVNGSSELTNNHTLSTNTTYILIYSSSYHALTMNQSFILRVKSKNCQQGRCNIPDYCYTAYRYLPFLKETGMHVIIYSQLSLHWHMNMYSSAYTGHRNATKDMSWSYNLSNTYCQCDTNIDVCFRKYHNIPLTCRFKDGFANVPGSITFEDNVLRIDNMNESLDNVEITITCHVNSECLSCIGSQVADVVLDKFRLRVIDAGKPSSCYTPAHTCIHGLPLSRLHIGTNYLSFFPSMHM